MFILRVSVNWVGQYWIAFLNKFFFATYNDIYLIYLYLIFLNTKYFKLFFTNPIPEIVFIL